MYENRAELQHLVKIPGVCRQLTCASWKIAILYENYSEVYRRIGSILKNNGISNFYTNFQEDEISRVVSVGDGNAHVYGLNKIQAGDTFRHNLSSSRQNLPTVHNKGSSVK